MISIVVIGKNEGARLSACMQSIHAAAGVLSHEIVYVDSRSDDDSLFRAAACGARCYVLQEENTTAGLGRYVGTKEAKGEYLLFLDGDMQLQKGFCEAALMAVAGGCDGCTGIREDLYIRDGEIAGRNENYFGCTKQRVAPEFGGALFIKKDALERAGGWSADTVACEEAELHARLIACGLCILELPVPMIVHTDNVRDGRGALGVILSRRRLGEGQALRCAMAHRRAMAYLQHEHEKFFFYMLDLMCVLLVLLLGVWGFLGALFFQAAQLGSLLSRKRVRSFVSQKLFFFAFPAGLLSYRVRSRAYTKA